MQLHTTRNSDQVERYQNLSASNNDGVMTPTSEYHGKYQSVPIPFVQLRCGHVYQSYDVHRPRRLSRSVA